MSAGVTVTETKSAAAHLLSDDAMKMLIQAIITCRQDYCNAQTCGVSDGLIQQLQKFVYSIRIPHTEKVHSIISVHHPRLSHVRESL